MPTQVNSVTGRKTLQVPLTTTLAHNYPNPFNGETRIAYTVRGTGDGAWVTLKVFDILGREVASLVDEPIQEGDYTVRFNRLDFPSGVYFYTLHAGGTSVTRAMMLLK